MILTEQNKYLPKDWSSRDTSDNKIRTDFNRNYGELKLDSYILVIVLSLHMVKSQNSTRKK